MSELRDEFLSEEDLDLKNLSEEELYAVWNAWLLQAQSTNDQDAHLYSHGVFEREPPWDDPADPPIGANGNRRTAPSEAAGLAAAPDPELTGAPGSPPASDGDLSRSTRQTGLE